MVTDLINDAAYFSGNMESLTVTGVDGYLDVRLKAGDMTAIEERFYPMAGKVALYDLGEVLQEYFSFPDLAVSEDICLMPSIEVSLRFQDSDTVLERTFRVYYSRCRVTPVEVVSGRFYSRYRQVDTAVGNEEYVPLCAGDTTVLKVGVAHMENGKARFMTREVSLGGHTGMIAVKISLERIASLSGLAAGDILFYDVTVSDGNGSDSIRYNVDRRNYRNITRFIYLDCFGLPQTLAFTGLVEYAPELDGDIVSLLAGDMRPDARIVDMRTVNSGYLTGSRYEALVDMTASADIRRYEKGTVQKIVVTDMDFTHRLPGNERFAVSLTYRPAERYHGGFERILDNNGRGIFDQTFDYTFN